MISTLIFTNIAMASSQSWCPSTTIPAQCSAYPGCYVQSTCAPKPSWQCSPYHTSGQCIRNQACEWSATYGCVARDSVGRCGNMCGCWDTANCEMREWCGTLNTAQTQQQACGRRLAGDAHVDEDASGDAVEPDNSGDVDEPEDTEGRRRITHNDAYCRKYSRESQCNIDSVCTWQQGWWSGTCVGKIVTGCQSHEQWDCASCTGNNGYPCNWVGTSQVGSCVEQTSPSPSPSGTCGMFYRQDSCPANCQWSYWKNECVEKVSPSPSPSTCGMFYSETSCPANCHWSYMQNKCVSGSNTGDCSQYGSFWPCSSTQGCKWNIIQNTCSSSGSHPIFCDTLMSESWCRMFESQCTWSSYHNQCLARGN